MPGKCLGQGGEGVGCRAHTRFGSCRSLLEKLSSTSRGRPAVLTRPFREVGVIDAMLLPRWDKVPPILRAEPGRREGAAGEVQQQREQALSPLCIQ